MSKFRKFLAKEAGPPASMGKPISWTPDASSQRTLGIDPGLGQLGLPPVGGWQSAQDYAQWKAGQMKAMRLFDLTKLAKAIGKPEDKAKVVIEKFSSIYGQPFSYESATHFLRELKQRTDSVRMVLASTGTTPSDPDISARLEGAHFRGQGPHDTGNEHWVDQDWVDDLDKKLYSGEVSGRGGGVGAFEIGEAIYAIIPSGERNGGQVGRFDVSIPTIEQAIFEFSKMKADFDRKLAYGVVSAGIGGKMGHKMLQPSTGTQLGHNVDSFAPGSSAV